MSIRLAFACSFVLVALSACPSEPSGDSSSDAGSATAATTTTTDATGPTTTSESTTDAGSTTTTTTSTPTTSTSSTTTDDSTSETGATTGEPFLCAVEPDGCCVITIEVEADTFFSDAVDGIGGGCPVVQGPNEQLDCEHWSFGKAQAAPLFKDNGMFDSAVAGTSLMALRFPMQDGALLSEDGPIPSEVIVASRLELAAQIDWDKISDLQFAVHALDPDESWQEGDALDATPCIDGLSSWACAECGPSPEQCDTPWASMPPMTSLGVVAAPDSGGPGVLALDLAALGEPSSWVPAITSGLVLAPSSSTYEGMANEEWVPFGPIVVEARESQSLTPRLHLTLCQP
ncbi:hypothetical protein [Nannocystis radixulma]|uniref:Uncharacterized protein n=1 Tax=Nannocystis radixulma TaxID=2995305 RepID=A0ABT5B3W8_9BACT|nr:hypothetical protein [Nannocystis radixulma]MDC0668168.1 hypothetical protein [Nannocystis radixulma]